MESHSGHAHHDHHHHHHHHHAVKGAAPAPAAQTSHAHHGPAWRMALSATLHCLLGCGIGEVVGMTISMSIGLAVLPSIALSVTLGFVFGLLLGVIPWRRDGYSWPQALKAVLIAEGLSIVVMEAAEVTAQLYIPGLMQAHLTSSLFWLGMAGALAAGFVAAYPVNLWLIRRGVVHRH